MKIGIINGPNLNLLGKREKDIYGDQSFDTYLTKLKADFPSVTFQYFQSNVEGELVNCLQDWNGKVDGIILNAAAYTHTSVAIHDAIKAISTQVIEVHISQPLAREEFRHQSIIAAACKGSISGFGLLSYELALEAFLKGLSKQ